MAHGVDQLAHELTTAFTVRLAVGGDHGLVDAPGDLDLDVGVGGEQRLDPRALSFGEQVGSGVQGAPGGVERWPR